MARARARHGTRVPLRRGPPAPSRSPLALKEEAVGDHVAVVEDEREVRRVTAFRSPFGHDLCGARGGHGEMPSRCMPSRTRRMAIRLSGRTCPTALMRA